VHRGYIKVWRKVEDSGLLQLPNTFALFMYILISASHKDRKMGTPNGAIEVKRGQFISGRKELALRLKQSEQQVRTSLERLKKMGIITIKATNKYSVYTIVNYDIYQDRHNEITNTTSNKQPSDSQQVTTKQECKNLRIKNNKSANQNFDYRASKLRGVTSATDDSTLLDLAKQYKVETYQQSKPSLVAKLNRAMGIK
jgi:biotin operon repressor